MRDQANLLVMTDTTDSLGMYSFSKIPLGDYNLQALNPANGTRLFKGRTRVFDRQDTLPAEMLHKPAVLEVRFADHRDPPDGYVFIIGTLISDTIKGGTGYVLIDSVPAGNLPAVFYEPFQESSDTSLLIADTVRVLPGDSAFIFYHGWDHADKIYFNTTASGAGISKNVVDFPVLVRLDSTNFIFSEMQGNERDVRFAKPNNVPLPFEIARWDSAGSRAEVWVRVDTVYAKDSTYYMLMRWGNRFAPGQSDPALSCRVSDIILIPGSPPTGFCLFKQACFCFMKEMSRKARPACPDGGAG
jgi:hypothetical protein